MIRAAKVLVLTVVSALRLAGQGTDTVNAERVGQKVQEALEEALSTGLGGLVLDKAELTLEVGRETRGGLTVNLLIFTISSRKDKGSTEKIDLVFDRTVKIREARKRIDDLKEPLARAIAVAGATASQIKALPLKEASIKLEFAVDVDTGGGLKFQLLGMDVGGQVNEKRTSKNSLTVTFAR